MKNSTQLWRKSLEATSDFPDCSGYEGAAVSSLLWCRDLNPLWLLSRTAIPLDPTGKYSEKQQKAPEVATWHKEKLENIKMAGKLWIDGQPSSTNCSCTSSRETGINHLTAHTTKWWQLPMEDHRQVCSRETVLSIAWNVSEHHFFKSDVAIWSGDGGARGNHCALDFDP